MLQAQKTRAQDRDRKQLLMLSMYGGVTVVANEQKCLQSQTTTRACLKGLHDDDATVGSTTYTATVHKVDKIQ